MSGISAHLVRGRRNFLMMAKRQKVQPATLYCNKISHLRASWSHRGSRPTETNRSLFLIWTDIFN
jgi:hypothetical protein